MDSRGNLYEEIQSGVFKDLEKEGVIKNVKEIDGIIPIMPSEAERARSMELAERLAFYNKKVAETVMITPDQLEGKKTMEETLAKALTPEVLTEPLTRKEREEMGELSTQAYGKRLHWQKVLRKGELRPGEVIQTSTGESIQTRKLHHFTVNEIKLTMQKILTDRAEAATKAEAERLEREKQQQAKETEAASGNAENKV